MAPPKGIGPGGGRLWRAVTTDYDLTDHELVILTQASRVADCLDDLAAVIGKGGIIDKDTGKVCPAAVEFRMQSIALARLIAALRLPDTDSRPYTKHRGIRGVYGVSGAGAS